MPDSKPSVQEGLQQLRISLVNKDFDKNRKDLDSVQARLEFVAVSGEADVVGLR